MPARAHSIALARVMLLTCAWLLSVTGGGAESVDTVINGAFEMDLSHGWMVALPDSGGIVDRDPGYDPDPDWEVQVSKSAATGTTRIDQIIELPHLDFDLFLRARIDVEAATIAWAVAAVMIGYVDEGGLLLGQTAIAAPSRWCPWESTPSFHLIEVPHHDWMDHGFNLADEIAAHLPAVDPQEVRSLRLTLYAYIDDC